MCRGRIGGRACGCMTVCDFCACVHLCCTNARICCSTFVHAYYQDFKICTFACTCTWWCEFILARDEASYCILSEGQNACMHAFKILREHACTWTRDKTCIHLRACDGTMLSRCPWGMICTLYGCDTYPTRIVLVCASRAVEVKGFDAS